MHVWRSVPDGGLCNAARLISINEDFIAMLSVSAYGIDELIRINKFKFYHSYTVYNGLWDTGTVFRGDPFEILVVDASTWMKISFIASLVALMIVF